MNLKVWILIFSLGTTLACASTPKHTNLSKEFFKKSEKPDAVMFGKASWYGHPFHGRKTASGERYNMNELTAAHKTLPMGTLIKVTNLQNEREVWVRVNDRGPYIHGRSLDLSKAAAQSIEMMQAGVSQIKMEVFYPRPSEDQLAGINRL